MAQGFDRIAPFYDLMMRAVFGRHIMNSQVYFFSKIPPQAKVLVIGGGTGWINSNILKAAPQAEIFYIEISSKMLALAENQLKPQHRSQVHLIQGDEEQLIKYAPYEVIITNFFLDLFTEERAEKIVSLFYHSLQTGGICIFTDFWAEKSRIGLRKWGINLMYFIARLLCKVEAKQYRLYENSFEKYPFDKEAEEYFFSQMIQSAVFRKKEQYSV